MENSEEIIKKRKEKIIEWIKNPYNLALILIFLGIIVIRFYYFLLTKNQPLWWDESQYMSTAKSIAGVVKYSLEGPRTPFFSLVMSLFFFLGINSEPAMRFVALLIPALIVIFLLYLTMNEMYNDKKVALISTAIFGVLWEHLFYSNRFHTENFSLIFLFLSTFILFRCYLKNQNLSFIKAKYSLLWIIFFAILSILFRAGTIVVFPALFLLILVLNKDKLLFTKKGRIALAGIIILAAFSLFFVPKLSIARPYIESILDVNSKYPHTWSNLSVFYGFYQSVMQNIPSILFYFFLAGIAIFFIELLLGYERLKTIKLGEENLELKSDIFSLLTIVFVLISFIFFIKSPTIEYRWFFPLLIGMFAFTVKGVIKVPEYIMHLIGIKNKKIILIVIIIIVGLGVYNQYLHSDMIIKMKVNSYEQVKDSGLYLKQISNPNDLIIAASQPQITYYSERETKGLDTNETDFDKFVNEVHPKYLVIDAFQPAPKWAYDWPQRHNETAFPLKAFYFDAEQKQTAAVVYELRY